MSSECSVPSCCWEMCNSSTDWYVRGERGNCLRNTLLSCKESEREGGMDRKEEINGQRMDDVMKSKWQ